jgi:hypothetical protein
MRCEGRPFGTSELDQCGGRGGVKWSQEIANWNYEEIGITLEIGTCGEFDKSRQPKWFGNFPHIFYWSAWKLSSNGKPVGIYKILCVLCSLEATIDDASDILHVIRYYIYICLWLGFLLCLDGTLLAFFFCLCFIHPCGSHNFSAFYTTTHWRVQRRVTDKDFHDFQIAHFIETTWVSPSLFCSWGRKYQVS